MNIIDIILKKKNKQELTKEELEFVINGYVNNEIPDYQVSSLLMAIVLNGMTLKETIDLTDVMLNSGEIINLDLPDLVDKHSTGGVGDKTTLILGPIVAASGVNVAKMSGRGLGHTGGTIDKLESIKGFQVSLEREEFIKQVKEIGLSVISQSGNIVPADKKIYALRDVTGTVESIPLIASSIMSKKIASGAQNIVIDVKVGNGALMKNEEDAKALAKTMIRIGESYNRKVVCVLTNMDVPLGKNIGNGLEVLESIEVLKGNGPKDLEMLCLRLGSIMVSMAKNISEEEAYNVVKENLDNGKALAKFYEFIAYQKGDINNISISNNIISIKSKEEGFITHIDTEKLGEIVKNIGGGRTNKEDSIDYGVGIVLNKKVGDLVFENEELVKVYISDKDLKINELLDCFTISEEAPKKANLVIDIIR